MYHVSCVSSSGVSLSSSCVPAIIGCIIIIIMCTCHHRVYHYHHHVYPPSSGVSLSSSCVPAIIGCIIIIIMCTRHHRVYHYHHNVYPPSSGVSLSSSCVLLSSSGVSLSSSYLPFLSSSVPLYSLLALSNWPKARRAYGMMVRCSSSVNNLHLHLLLWNCWAQFNQTLQEWWGMDGPSQKYLFSFWLKKYGRQG